MNSQIKVGPVTRALLDYARRLLNANPTVPIASSDMAPTSKEYQGVLVLGSFPPTSVAGGVGTTVTTGVGVGVRETVGVGVGVSETVGVGVGVGVCESVGVGVATAIGLLATVDAWDTSPHVATNFTATS